MFPLYVHNVPSRVNTFIYATNSRRALCFLPLPPFWAAWFPPLAAAFPPLAPAFPPFATAAVELDAFPADPAFEAELPDACAAPAFAVAVAELTAAAELATLTSGPSLERSQQLSI
jgi:hypothetical protein